MDYQDYITAAAERKKGQHLGMVERGAITALNQQGLGIRAIAREVGCAPSVLRFEVQKTRPLLPHHYRRQIPEGASFQFCYTLFR